MFFYLMLLFSCSSTPITGTVVDGLGQPILDVSVSVLGTECVTQSGKDGTYVLDCSPNKGTIALNKEGFIGTQFAFDFSVGDAAKLPEQSLIEIPPAAGLFIHADGSYHALTKATLLRTAGRNGKEVERRFCLQSQIQESTTVEPGEVSIFVYQYNGWRLFKLNADRCAYSDKRKASGRWVVGYREKPPVGVTSLGDGFSAHTASLGPGHYFAATWDGFFVATEPNPDVYEGHWFEVKE